MTVVESNRTTQRNPWFVVAGQGLIAMVGPAPLPLGTLGIFVVAITADVGWGRTQVTGGFTVAALAMAAGLVVVSRLLDRFALRYIVVPAVIGFFLGVAALGFAPPNHLLWLVTWGWLGFFGAAMGVPMAKATLSWFDNKRGLAVGLAAALTGLGGVILPIVATTLVGSIGWRAAYPALAAIGLVVALFAVFVLVRVRGERHHRGRLVQEVRRGSEVISLEQPGLTPRQALRSRHFWLIIVGLNISQIAIIGVQIHLVPMMIDRGLSELEAASLLSLLSGGAVIGRIVGGFLLDRIHGTIVGAAVLLVPVVGLLLLTEPYALAAVAVACIGFAAGVEVDLSSFFTTRYLGMRHLGFFLSVLGFVNLLMAAFGPLMLGIVYDVTGSYDVFMPFLIGSLVAAAVLILLLGKYRYSAIPGFDKVARTDELEASKLLADEAQGEDVELARGNADVDAPLGASDAPDGTKQPTP